MQAAKTKANKAKLKKEKQENQALNSSFTSGLSKLESQSAPKIMKPFAIRKS